MNHKTPELDKRIKAALQAEAGLAEVSPEAEAALFAEIARQGQRVKMPPAEFWTARRYSLRFLLSFCLIFCLSCVGVFGATAGNGKGWVTAGLTQHATTSYEGLPKLVEELDFEPRTVPSFTNGFSFTEGRICQTQGLDENGRRMSYIYKELDVNYKNPETGEEVILNICTLPGGFGRGVVEQRRQVGQITLIYMEQPYKFVPVDYVMTEADWAALESGALEISVGSDRVEENLVQCVVWLQGGVKYDLLGYDLSLTGEEMLDMAAELVEAQ